MLRPSRLLPLLALFTLAGSAHAQRAQGGAQFMVGVPLGAFYDRVETVGFGLSGQLLYHFGRAPIAVGVEGGFLVYDQERFNECLTTCRVRVDVVTSNNVALGHLVLRLQPASGTLRPYADVLAGVHYLFTESRLEDEDFGENHEIASSTNFDDAAFSYGAAAGILVQVHSGRTRAGRPYALHVDGRLRYLRGGEADYLRRGSIRETADGDLLFDVERSRTDLLLPQVGVTVRF
ncbi:MAG: hypothetical protein R3362_09090 [Rhodothermales bacterium]|nr:hypothetical protein [Rhodothermales bacterium]